MARYPTLQAIAAECGVSHSTVWRALREDPSVHPKTALRIRQFAEKVGYNSDARIATWEDEANSSSPTSTGSIIIPYNKKTLHEADDRIFWDFVEGATQAADSAIHGIQMAGFKDASKEITTIRALVEEKRVAGVLDFSLSSESIDYLLKMEIPMASYLTDVRHPDTRRRHGVYPDRIQGYVDAWRHLANHGHSGAGFLTVQPHGRKMPLLRECMAAAQLLDSVPQLDSTPAIIENIDSKDSIWNALVARWGKPDAGKWPSAIFCSHDTIAYRAIATLREQGLSVPRDLSIIGFGDSQIATLSDIPITTIKNPRREIGAIMLNIVENIIANRIDSQIRMQTLPMTLIPRSTVDKALRSAKLSSAVSPT